MPEPPRDRASPSATDVSSSIPEPHAPEANRRTILLIAGLGVAFDLSFNGQRPGLSIPIFTLILAAAIRPVARRGAEGDGLLACAVLFSIFPALRASAALTSLDVLAASALLALVATQDLEPLTSATVTGLVQRGTAILRRTLEVPRFVFAPFAAPGERGRIRGALRAVAITGPILVLFAALLASGDHVFARLLNSILPRWDLRSILGHIALALAGSTLVAVLWRSALGDVRPAPERATDGRLPALRFGEWAAVLGGIDLLFALFVIVQVAYLFGGHHRVRVTPGLTYAEYARSGFFQLAAAAALTVLVILAAWDAGTRDGRRHERWFLGLVTAMVALTGAVLASAVTRLALYEGTFGFTIKRFFGYVAIISIGGMLLVLLTAIWAASRRRVVAGFVLVGLAALLVVNLMNPDRFVADRNVARYEATGAVDLQYLGYELGLDAVPVAAALLRRLPDPLKAELRTALCERADLDEAEPSWRSANLGRSSARTALAAAGITNATCRNRPLGPAR